MINGKSGEEQTIKSVVYNIIAPYVDTITYDAYGNILAEKCYGRKNTTVLLNAHLDTVANFAPNRQIVKDGHIWSSSEGILGADDRAGIAVILEVAKRLPDTGYHGTVKFAFTVEEEIGLVGASHVPHEFLQNVDAAVVVDRRGTGDIVTSCGGYIPFCHEGYGRFFEQVALEADLIGWCVTAGGMSDTHIWAEHGIESVNLSVGYANEHTSAETLDVSAAFHTSKLVLEMFSREYDLRHAIR